MNGMNTWLWAAAAMLPALAMTVIGCFRGSTPDRLVALEMGGCLVAIELLLLVEGFRRPSFYDLPLTVALLTFGGGMVFTRFLQRWL